MPRQRNRRFIFVLNNPTEEEKAAIELIDCRFIIVGDEVGEEGTPHLQGYIELHRAVSFKIIKDEIGERAHIEVAKGTSAQNIEYCSKQKLWHTRGKPASAGARNDIMEVRAILAEGGGMRDVCAQSNSFQAIRGAELMLKYKAAEPRVPPIVHWYWGPSGSGKTRSAVEEAGDDMWMSSRNLKWWDGYDGQKNVVIDDFRGDFCTFHELLRIVDRYPFRVEVKGGSRWLEATKIWITSPNAPKDAYPGCGEKIEQLLRRIAVIRDFSPPIPVGTPVQGSGVILSPDPIDELLKDLV